MSEFKRGLKRDFVDQLNELYGEGEASWWKEMVDDPDTFVAIRNNYGNVYYRGASLARVEPSGGGVKASVHYKYLLKPRHPKEYVQVVRDGKINRSQLDLTSFMLEDPTEIRALKDAAKNYVGEEKTGVHTIAMTPDNAVVDLQIAISDGSSARRVDIAALVDAGDAVEVRFFEAKAFSNKELRAEGRPPVAQRIEAYRQLLHDHHSEVVSSYGRVCENFVNLEGLNHSEPRGSLLRAVAEEEKLLRVDLEPRLVVFGYDGDQRNGRLRRELEKLKGDLMAKPITRGNPKKLRLVG